jgi:hypothetical protein
MAVRGLAGHSTPYTTSPATTTTASASSPTAPITKRTDRLWARVQLVHAVTRDRTAASSRAAQAYSVPSNPMPAKMINQPGPGNGSNTTPTRMMPTPSSVMPIRHMTNPPGQLRTRARSRPDRVVGASGASVVSRTDSDGLDDTVLPYVSGRLASHGRALDCLATVHVFRLSRAQGRSANHCRFS